MKKIILVTIGVLLLIGVSFYILYLKWEQLPKIVSSIYVLDKTVSKRDYTEHKSFFWIINTLRIVKPDSSKYNFTKDYYGFYPIDPATGSFDFRSIHISQIEHLADSIDLLYYIDCYGVYSENWASNREATLGQKIYGGLNQNDYLLLKAMLMVEPPLANPPFFKSAIMAPLIASSLKPRCQKKEPSSDVRIAFFKLFDIWSKDL